MPIDGAHQFVLADFELRATHRISCFQERGLVLRRLDVGVRFSFDDFLLRLQQVAAILSQIVFLLAGIKFEYNIPCVHVGSGACQRDNLQCASGDRGSGDGSRLGSSQGACGENLKLKIHFFHRGCRNLRIRRQDGSLVAGNATAPQREHKEKYGFF